MAIKRAAAKVRRDSKLKTLSEPVQAALWDFSRTHSILEIVAWLKAEHGIASSTSGVSIWLRWYQLQQQSQQLDRDEDTFKSILKGRKPKLSPQELDQYAEVLFRIKSIRDMDAKTYCDVTFHRRKQDLDEMKFHQEERKLALAEKRLALQVKQAEDAEKITRTPMSDEEKMAQIRQLFNINAPPEDGA